ISCAVDLEVTCPGSLFCCDPFWGCYNIAKQCTKPKRKMDETWFNDKVLLVQAQASGQALTEEEIAFLADPGLPDIQTS
ncbi:hypothetical protein Tco_0198706, partial [Tanacetum coccineum]